jgi:hypothetical protein
MFSHTQFSGHSMQISHKTASNKHKNNDIAGPPPVPVNVNVMGMGGQQGYMPPEMMPHPGMQAMAPPGGMPMQVYSHLYITVPWHHAA